MSAEQYRTLLIEASDLLRRGYPAQALSKAQEASAEAADPLARDITLAAFYVDAGSDLKRPALVRKGAEMLRSSLNCAPPTVEGAIHYNLGNAYAALGRFEKGTSPGTKPSLSLAVSHLDRSLQFSPSPNARTNLAGCLSEQGRLFEAVDEFSSIIEEVPEHHTARAKRGYALIGLFQWTQHHSALLAAAQTDHELAVALAVDEPVFARSYQGVLDWLKGKVRPIFPTPVSPTPDQEWIWGNRLALNPCPICRIESPEAFDLYPLPARLEAPRRRPPVAHVIELVNSLCRSFATARWLLYHATGPSNTMETDHVISLPGIPGAQQTLRIGLAMASVSSFYSVLSQTSFALDSYLGLHHDPLRLNLDTVWGQPRARGFPTTRSRMHPGLRRRAVQPLSALYRLAESLQHGLGRYERLRSLRNHLEHHIVVAVSQPGASGYFHTIGEQSLIQDALVLGRLAKAAVWYLSATILAGEVGRLRVAKARGVIGYGTGSSVMRQ